MNVIDLTFEALELLANDKEFDDRYFTVYNLPNIDEIMLNFHSLISAKLQGNDKLIFSEYSYKFLVIINNVYYTIAINVLYNCNPDDCSAEFLLKKFNNFEDANKYYISIK